MCVLLFVIQHAKRARHIVICGLSDIISYFSTLSDNGRILGKKN